MPNFVSLCVLSYKRNQLLIDCINSLHETIDYPCEIIVNCDAGDTAYDLALGFWREKQVSKVVVNNGQNRGVGRSFQNCLAVSEGKYVFKIDADLTFDPHWLSDAIKILKSDPTIGTVGLFDYHQWDPLDSRFKPETNVIKEAILPDNQTAYYHVEDFVSSIFGFEKQRFLDYMKTMGIENIPDDGMHTWLKHLALLPRVKNTAFGVGKSTYVSGTNENPYKTPTADKPLLFKADYPSF